MEHTIPISERTGRRGLVWFIRALCFGILFDLCCLGVQGSQWLLLPTRLLYPKWWDQGIRYTKASFAIAMIWMSQWFAPTEFVVTTEGDYFQNERVLEKDRDGNVTRLNLPPKLLIMSNHQVYLDWWYLWCFTYWTEGHRDVIIVLKKSLKWIPIIGWGMIWFRFIFLERSWAADSKYFIAQLRDVGERAKKHPYPLTFFLFPEGTLVSPETRPASQKWASKLGVDDVKHMLLPRARGLHYTLRALSPRIPDLHILDVAMAYEGIARGGYGQSYYTLRSVFFDGVPPPRIHLHLKLYRVQTEIPIGHVDAYGEQDPSKEKREDEITKEESDVFERWLLGVWREKDGLMDDFLTDGCFKGTVPSKGGVNFRIPVRLRSSLEILKAAGFFGPGFIVFGIARLTRSLAGMGRGQEPRPL